MRVYHAPSIAHLRRAAGRSCGLIFRNRNGVTDLYERRVLPNPDTGEQRLSRQAWSRSCAGWRELSKDHKLAWNGFAVLHGRTYAGRQPAEPLTGYRLFQSTAGNLQILGLPMPAEVPVHAPPEGVRTVELLPSVEPNTLRLRVEHGLSASGFRVVVSMSPATLRVSRKPDRRAGRHVCGWGEGSTAPLPVSGGEVVFTGCRYSVKPGQRFGVWIRVVRESDGLGSAEMFLDFIRPEPDEAITNYELPITNCGVAERRIDREQQDYCQGAKGQGGDAGVVNHWIAAERLITDLSLRHGEAEMRQIAEGAKPGIWDG